MKKKILMLTVVFMLVCGVVSASSINGQYKGDEIVKVFHDGKELQVEDVPAILHDDRTLVPIYLFKQMGVELTWDLEKYSVDVKLPNEAHQATSTNVDVDKIAGQLGNLVSDVSYSSSGTLTVDLTFDLSADTDAQSTKVLNASVYSGAKTIVLKDKTSTITTMPAKAYMDQAEGKITPEEFAKTVQFSFKSKSDTDLIIANAKAANFYQTLDELGQRIQQTSHDFEMVYNHYMLGTDPGVSIQTAYDSFNNAVDRFNAVNNSTGVMKSDLSKFKIETGPIDTIISNYSKAIDYLRTSLSAVDNLSHGYNRADYNKYFDNASTALSYSMDNTKTANDNYRKHIDAVIK